MKSADCQEIARQTLENLWYNGAMKFAKEKAQFKKILKNFAETLDVGVSVTDRQWATSSNPGDIVLDPFAGTFTTCAVAQKLDRHSIGVEKEEEYVKIGLRRLGIQTEIDGEKLLPPHKNHIRRNKNGVKATTAATKSLRQF